MMNAEVFAGLLDAWQQLREDRDVWVAVLTAAGDVDFCAGGDLGDLIPLWTGSETAGQRAGNPSRRSAHSRRGDAEVQPARHADHRRGERSCPRGRDRDPVVDGHPGGREHATFGLPEPRAGIVPARVRWRDSPVRFPTPMR